MCPVCPGRKKVRMSESTTEGRPAGRLLLEALAVRDFDLVSECFEPAATMRAMLPRGLVELTGAPQIVALLRGWFEVAEEFEVLHTTVDRLGDRLHVAWRFRQHPTPRGDGAWHVIEQQAYLQAGECIHAVDLLCSGFRPNTRPSAEAHHTTERVQQ
jgi:hypothetical protein